MSEDESFPGSPDGSIEQNFNVEAEDFDALGYLATLASDIREESHSSNEDMAAIARNQSRAMHWCFTTNNYTPEQVTALRQLASDPSVKYLIFGREVGETGTPHLQGFISFEKRTRFSNVQALVPDSHLEVTRKVQHAIEYCKKENDFEEFGEPPAGPGCRTDITAFKAAVQGSTCSLKRIREEHSEFYARYPRFCIEYLRDNQPEVKVATFPLRKWQQKLNHELLLPPDNRRIIFVVDYIGNSGKSWFSRYYCGIHENAQILVPTKKADMAFALRSDIRVLFLDAPRSKQGEFIQYDFLEELKNGMVMSSKYESYMKTFEPVHVVVMMNERPDENKLSQDRYDIRELKREDLERHDEVGVLI